MQKHIRETGMTVGVISPRKSLVAVYFIEETDELIRTPIVAIAFEQDVIDYDNGPASVGYCDPKPIEFDPNPYNPQFAYVSEQGEDTSFLGYELEEAPHNLEFWKKFRQEMQKERARIKKCKNKND